MSPRTAPPRTAGPDAAGALLFTGQDMARMVELAPLMERASRQLRAGLTAGPRLRALLIALTLARERDRKVYGGYALNACAWGAGALEHAFYGPPLGMYLDAAAARMLPPPRLEAVEADIEFYSPDAVADAIELCDRLHAAGLTDVQSKEACHADTFTVTVDYARVCDITLVPRRIFDALPAYAPLADGVLCVAPQHAALDLMSQISDPVQSHWRIGHVLSRLHVVQHLFGLLPPDAVCPASAGDPEGKTEPTRPSMAGTELDTVRQAQSPYWVWVGSGAVDLLFPKAQETDQDEVAAVRRAAARLLEVAGWEVISTSYDQDVAWAKARLPPGTQALEYRPTIDLLDRRCVFSAPGEARSLLTIYDHRGKSVPTPGGCAPGTPDCPPASFTYVVMLALARGFLARVEGDYTMLTTQQELARAMLAARAVQPGSAVDPASLLRDVPLHVMGQAQHAMAAHMRAADARRAQFGPRASVWLKYTPGVTKPPHWYPYTDRDGAPVSTSDVKSQPDDPATVMRAAGGKHHTRPSRRSRGGGRRHVQSSAPVPLGAADAGEDVDGASEGPPAAVEDD